ncbi:hypothetical protein [Phenylobacterium sp.]|uniref:hypothetical protein n=1 Tax=Phenylobacterium sp. TaxID=1871053 RepID=UPI0035B20FEF
MRRAVLILGLSFALVAPAGAQETPNKAPRKLQVVPAEPRKAAPPPADETPPVVLLAPPAPQAPALDAGQCRLTCAQSYYFCLSSDTPDDCPGAWSQCRAACDAPSAAPGM